MNTHDLDVCLRTYNVKIDKPMYELLAISSSKKVIEFILARAGTIVTADNVSLANVILLLSMPQEIKT